MHVWIDPGMASDMLLVKVLSKIKVPLLRFMMKKKKKKKKRISSGGGGWGKKKRMIKGSLDEEYGLIREVPTYSSSRCVRKIAKEIDLLRSIQFHLLYSIIIK